MLTKNPIEGVSLDFESKSDELCWNVDIKGPIDSPYENGIFKVLLNFPADYPFKSPKVCFLTKTWNPSISLKGEVCLELLNQWKPVVQVRDLLGVLKAMFEFPTHDAAQNADAGTQLKEDKETFERIAREWTQSYAAP